MYQFITLLTKFQKGLLVALVTSVFNISAAFAQNCSATLKVEKDRNAKSAYSDDAAVFNMVLTNTSANSVTYIMDTKNLTESCATENKKTATPNVPLNVEVRAGNSTGAVGNSITLRGGETRSFKIYVSVPPRTPFNTWSCIEVSAKGAECNEATASTVLRVFVPEPSEG